MEICRGQLSRDAIASSSGRFAGHRSHPMCLHSRAQKWVQPSPRVPVGHRDVAGTNVPAVACHALSGVPQPLPSGLSGAAAAAAAGAVTTAVSSQPQTTTTTLAPPAPQQRPPAQQQPPQQPPQQQPPPTPGPDEDPGWRSSLERVQRLNTLVETRRLYRNCVRAEYLLALNSPLYTAEQAEAALAADGQGAAAGPKDADNTADADAAESDSRGGSPSGSLGSISGGSPLSTRGGGSTSTSILSTSLGGPGQGSGVLVSGGVEEDKALKSALEGAAEMVLVMEQLKASLRSLPAGFGSVIFPPASAATDEEAVREVARQHVGALRDRLAAELPLLPIASDAAIQFIESRNAKFSRRVALDERQGGAGSHTSGGGGGGGSAAGAGQGGGGGGGPAGELVAGTGRTSALERLEAAERVAGEIIANSIKPALKKAAEQDLLEVMRGTGDYLRGLWVRLNGGAPATRWGMLGPQAGRDLPRPEGTQQRSELAISRLSLDLEGLEKRLQEASKRRENKLRKAGLQGRVQMAIQLKGLDAEVLHLSSLLAVRTLQLEMEYVYGSLEAEALDVFNGLQAGGLLARDGSTNELQLLVAEFALLDEQLTIMAATLEGGTAATAVEAGLQPPAPAPASMTLPTATAAAPSPPAAAAIAAPRAAMAAAAAAMGPALINDEVLSKLALEIPDMRSRVGVADQVVFGGQGFSLTKARLQLRESLDKVREGVTFLTRGFKLLGSDVATGARLFLKAALGNTLKPREVSALRRTARDLLTFIPFTIILLVPLSPLGHVLVFGFIQRYFPSFFPSQFSSRRQDIMVRYEELERQLLEAQAAAEAAEEEVELARAREAVARLRAAEPLDALAVAATAAAGGVAEAVGASGGGNSAAAAATGANGGVSASDSLAPGPAVLGGSAPAGTVRIGGAAAGGGAAAAVVAMAGGGGGSALLSSVSATSSVDEVTLHEATQKVRILSEQLDEIRDDVHMGDPLAEGGDGGGGGGGAPGTAAHGGGGARN